MLDQETKRKIDNARDILVGKVPDPKSQVEQITIALIYKFMDDMDKESVEWGGKATFFSGEYERYAWSKIFDPRLGGFEIIDLYGNAIIRMNQNPQVPQLFRDIFKNAYLPYRDPETLKSFLKEINEFTYDHSERLGDAFEYLLSVLSSQGDAGQFRTPRHIIDFIVEIVDPKKNEMVLDPACGTAGFLISSYRHILEANRDTTGDQLTPDEKKRLMSNFAGYDISPDMVRLSLVNMYLHGFPDPKIHEYDTLTSEQRWNETFDVILANPPFMSPRGGIRPHKRFSIQAKRSEVLFVDYIAEHLNPNGRAGVIVPEGIIFQAQNAYKNLRKMLVEEYLWAVVSLPAGVFQPYSGVKTSVLLMDKTLSKKTNRILFMKIENDGFDLGAQRRPIDQNDLPKALDFVKSYQQAVLSSRDIEDTDFAHVVEKAKIAESGDWNLSGGRYREVYESPTSGYELKRFDEVCTLEYGASLPKENRTEGEYPVVGSNGITGWHNEYLVEAPAIIVGRKGSAGEVVYIDKPCFPIDTTYYVKVVDKCKVDMNYLYFVLKELDLPALKGGAGIPGLNRNDVYEMRKIPLPPFGVQKAIVAEIDGYQKIIDGARQVVENYKPTIKIDPDWEMVQIKNVCHLTNGKAFKPSDWEREESGGLPIIRIQNLNDPGAAYNYYTGRIKEKFIVNPGDLLFSWSGSRGTSFGPHIWHNVRGVLNQHIFRVDHTEAYNRLFLYFALKNIVAQVEENLHGGVGLVHITKGNFEVVEIPKPPLSVQQKIVAQIEAEQELVNGNKKLMAIYEQKIKDKIAEVWGD